jgi:CRP/FNR family cyclic AMP-dependent transcriptional regulator
MKLEINLEDSISRSSLFKGIRGADMLELSGKAKIVKFKKGDYIVNEGEMGEDFFWISKGSVEIQVKAGTESAVVINTLKHGDVLGELALFGVVPRSASALVIEDVEAHRWVIGDCHTLFKEKPNIGYQLLLNLGNMLSQRLSALNKEFKFKSQFDIKMLQNLG